MKIDQLREEINKLAVRAVLDGEGSVSCHRALGTGPRYQKIEVANNEYEPFRSERRDRFLREIPFEDTRVLDIGCNMGVTSRLVGGLGANEVVGLEYDPYFVTVGNLVNTSLGVENVRFTTGDATDPREYDRLGRFDITLALSSMNYAQHAMEKINDITREIFVVETHRALPGCLRTHLDIVTPYFPEWRVLGFTDHGRMTDDHRLFIVFSRGHVDLSCMSHYDDHWETFNWEIELQKTDFSYLRAFFAAHPHGFMNSKVSDDLMAGITGALYWEKFLIGYLQWDNGAPLAENVYYLHLRKLYRAGYPGGEILNTRADHQYIIDRRYETMRDAYNGKYPEYPIKVKVLPSSRGPYHFYSHGSWRIAPPDGIGPSFDGIHRCFMYKYLGFDRLAAQVTIVD